MPTAKALTFLLYDLRSVTHGSLGLRSRFRRILLHDGSKRTHSLIPPVWLFPALMGHQCRVYGPYCLGYVAGLGILTGSYF